MMSENKGLIERRDELVKLFHKGLKDEYYKKLAELMAEIYLGEIKKFTEVQIQKFLEQENKK